MTKPKSKSGNNLCPIHKVFQNKSVTSRKGFKEHGRITLQKDLPLSVANRTFDELIGGLFQTFSLFCFQDVVTTDCRHRVRIRDMMAFLGHRSFCVSKRQ